MTTRRRFLAITAAALAARPARAAPARWQGVALGAEADITLYGDGAEASLDAVRAEIRRAERLFSLYDPGSALSRLNTTGALDPAPPDMLALLSIADRVYRATGGRFDPSVQPLWLALAEGGDVEAARRFVGWDAVRLSRTGVHLGPGRALTLNGIAQGFATDKVAGLLARQGFGRALVHVGEHRAMDGPWRLALEDPEVGFLGTRTLTDAALATSSPGALWLGPGTGHILDPSGMRAPLWSTVSVEAPLAALADALSTAFCLMTEAEIRAARSAIPEIGRITLVDADGNLGTL